MPAGQLADKLVLITGASRGVGAELARVFAREGAYIIVNHYVGIHLWLMYRKPENELADIDFFDDFDDFVKRGLKNF